ncbi:hypothetical protein [Actinoplanes sp. N902-109]|uniref:hypothetical protein n=1 Tax=Actinoplanes sp. (strain N902-109) TaxID=649831 RepID=UPI00032951FA|nr:hypothetical protein [Actinoplanes sp. N902-109]AGL15302.1 hypothetical protein L083_1792 [Actinoplanes sp. N902-109]
MPLFIGADYEKTVVSPYPLKMRAGRARRYRYGSVTEVVPRSPSGRTRPERTRDAGQLALVLIVVTALVSALGVPWLAIASGCAILFLAMTGRRRRAAQPGTVALPRGDAADVLYAPQERAAYGRAVATARRVRKTWPALHHMIDPDEADRGLTTALRDLASVLARRQQIRRLRDELEQAAAHGLAPDSPAARALAEQRDRVAELWRESGDDANRILAAVHAAAVAGENLIRELRVHQTARDAELAISRLTAAAGPASDAAPELAGRTAAVIAAYRELTGG